MITAPGRLTPQPRLNILVANRLDVMRQTTNATAISKKVVECFSFIFAVFIVVPVTLVPPGTRRKDRKNNSDSGAFGKLPYIYRIALQNLRIRRDVVGEPDVAAYNGIVPDGDAPEYRRIGIDGHVVLQYRMAR